MRVLHVFLAQGTRPVPRFARILWLLGAAMALILSMVPSRAFAEKAKPAAFNTTIKGQSCGTLLMQQNQYPFATAMVLQTNLQELDGITGQAVQNMGLCGGSWSAQVISMVPTMHSSTSYTRSFSLDGNRVTFVFAASVYNQTTVLTNSGEQVVVPQGAVKYSISISGWPFLNFNDSLQLGETTLFLASGVKALRNTQMQITLPQNATIDGNTMPIGIQSHQTAAGRGTLTTFTFPIFGELSYDPVISWR